MVALQTLRMPLLLGGCTLAVLATPVAHAHGIESTLERLGRSTLNSPYQLESKFSTGAPAQDAAVRMVSPTGDASVALGHTNGDGQLTFTLPVQAKADWEVQVDAGPGHRDYLELPEPSATSTEPARVSRSRPYPRLEGWAYLPPLGVFAVAGLAGMLRTRRPS